MSHHAHLGKAKALFSSFLKTYFIFNCVWGIVHICAGALGGGSPGSIGDCEISNMNAGKLNLGPLGEQCAFLSSEPPRVPLLGFCHSCTA